MRTRRAYALQSRAAALRLLMQGRFQATPCTRIRKFLLTCKHDDGHFLILARV